MIAGSFVEERLDKGVEGDAELFRVLYPPLRRLAAVVRPAEVEPDDLVQEAVERTIRNRPLSELDNPSAYLSRVILNLASEHRRRLGRARRSGVRLRPDMVVDQFYPSDLDDLFRLPPLQRAILFLGEVEGLTHADIAGQLGMSVHAVAKASQRARKRLRVELTEEMS